MLSATYYKNELCVAKKLHLIQAYSKQPSPSFFFSLSAGSRSAAQGTLHSRGRLLPRIAKFHPTSYSQRKHSDEHISYTSVPLSTVPWAVQDQKGWTEYRGWVGFAWKLLPTNHMYLLLLTNWHPLFFTLAQSLCTKQYACCIQDAKRKRRGKAFVAPNVNLLIVQTLHAGSCSKRSITLWQIHAIQKHW